MHSSEEQILVFGSTGETGGQVARQLIAAGHKPRLLVRSADKAASFADKATIIEGSYRDEAALSRALSGIEKIYLVSGLSVESSAHEIEIIDAAKKAAVKHVVKLSVVTADHPEIPFAHWHARTEKHLVGSGLAWTMLRPGNFHTNALLAWAQSIKSQNTFYQPTADGKWASIDPADIGAVAVKALTEPGHEGKAYTLTGAQLLSAAEYAKVFSEALGRPILFVDIPLSAFRDRIVAAGFTPTYADAAVQLLAAMRENRWTEISSDVGTLLGRPPVSFSDWLRRNIAAFQ